MSSNDSMSSSRLSQFGLYRTIDARTEEFLKLSRKRQIRQGCACAAVSTAITVTVVVVILIIYEYAIAVEWSLVQKSRAHRKSDNISTSHDSPVADRLDRSYFGFDQDYFERMPLLVNAMQENSYVDPFVDIPTQRRGSKMVSIQHTITTTPMPQGPIRRTSPRPFIYEMRSPTPVPFSKTFGSKSWIESYRNAQRLKNIQEIIKYLEKTVNAKAADFHSVPSTHIAFSGVYVEPMVHNKHSDHNQDGTDDLLAVSSNREEVIKSNHLPDPLYRFKPDTPSDVNMLADSYLRFLPIADYSFTNRTEHTKIPMFKPIPSHHRNNPTQSSSDKYSTVLKPKTFSVMLSLFPLLNSHSDWKNGYTTKPPPPVADIISITTTRRPQFRRKSNVPIRRIIQYKKRPRLLNVIDKHKSSTKVEKDFQNISYKPSNMVLHINLYTPDKTTEPSTYNSTFSREQYGLPTVSYEPTTEIPFKTSTVKVEDFHMGSSGIIPIESRSNSPTPALQPLPKVTTMTPFFDITPSSDIHSFTTPTPPEIMKFSHEDAKIPHEYQNYRPTEEYDHVIEFERRSMKESFETKMDMESREDIHLERHIYLMNDSKVSDDELNDTLSNWDHRKLLVKLKNILENETSDEITEAPVRDNLESTTAKQTNGHSRHLNQNYRILNKWLDPNSEENRKRRYELYAKGFRRASFNTTYVEIKRNKTAIINEKNISHDSDANV
ncbi:uncharacterized protein LOC106130792 [Amyelois transitella]|uniref:uncharacterized protein LOC106130792 n=1 Tax=Amyelois transitella TaxID=680683 RepID=UPI00067DDC8A|nr:uncharacterized protein LOC106130792 [Amyelois transitella]